MKNTLYAILTACTAMFATSGLVALATAAPTQAPIVQAEDELVEHLDHLIASQLSGIKLHLGITSDR